MEFRASLLRLAFDGICTGWVPAKKPKAGRQVSNLDQRVYNVVRGYKIRVESSALGAVVPMIIGDEVCPAS